MSITHDFKTERKKGEDFLSASKLKRELIAQHRACNVCGKLFQDNDVLVYSRKLDIAAHLDCWAEETGEVIEKYPLHDHVRSRQEL